MSNNQITFKREKMPKFDYGDFTSFVLPKNRITDLIKDKEFPDCALYLYLYLLRAGSNWAIWPDDYMEKTGKSLSTYHRGLKVLKEYNILYKDDNGGWVFNPY